MPKHGDMFFLRGGVCDTYGFQGIQDCLSDLTMQSDLNLKKNDSRLLC